MLQHRVLLWLLCSMPASSPPRAVGQPRWHSSDCCQAGRPSLPQLRDLLTRLGPTFIKAGQVRCACCAMQRCAVLGCACCAACAAPRAAPTVHTCCAMLRCTCLPHMLFCCSQNPAVCSPASAGYTAPHRIACACTAQPLTHCALPPIPVQVLANRPDIVREDYMNELCVLQDDVPPFPDEQASAWCSSVVLKLGAGGHPHSIVAGLGWAAWAASPLPLPPPPFFFTHPFLFLQAFAIIESSLGRPLGEVFSSISERPVAAASLGQVCLLCLLRLLAMRLLMLLATPPSRWLDG